MEKVSPARTSASGRDVRVAAAAGVLGFVAYIALVAAPLPGNVAATLAAMFGPGVMVASWALWSVLRAGRRSASADLGFVSNALAGSTVTSMVLVQIAAGPHAPGVTESTKLVWLGLDVAWDVYLVLGTALFAWSMVGHPRFGWRLAGPGFLIAGALFALNMATFPEPPASVALPDLGPVIGLYYVYAAVAVWRSADWLDTITAN